LAGKREKFEDIVLKLRKGEGLLQTTSLHGRLVPYKSAAPLLADGKLMLDLIGGDPCAAILRRKFKR